MTIVSHVIDQTSHVLFIKTDTPTIGLIALSGFTDVTNESLGHTYTKTFRYSQNGITFSDWMPLTINNIAAIPVTQYDTLIVEYKYDPQGDTTLTFNSVTITATQSSLSCGVNFTNSIFAQLLDCNDIEVLEWYLNVTEKLFNTGILARYISRTDSSNSPEDFILFWKSITKFFGFYVVWARKWRDFHENNDLIIEYLRQKGLYIEDFQTLSDCKAIMASFNQEMRRRGTLQITQNYVVNDFEINGELLRLIGFETGDEFIFNPYKDEHLGWCIDTASPLFKGLQFNQNANKAWEKNAMSDSSKYPVTGTAFYDIEDDTDNDGNPIKVFHLSSGSFGGIGFTGSNVFPIIVDNELDYLIAFKIKVISDDNLFIGIDAQNNAYNPVNLSSNKDGLISNTCFSGAIPAQTKYMQVNIALYNFSKTFFSQDALNFGLGNNLIMSEDTKYIVPNITIENGSFNFYDLQIVPLQTNYERGWIQTKNFISNWILNKNQKYTIKQLEQIYRHYFIPYDAYCKITNIGDDLYNDIDVPFTPFEDTFHWIGGAYTCDTGVLTYTTLFQVSNTTEKLTGAFKTNDISDPDYIAPSTNHVLCPVATTTTTTTTSTTTTTTTSTTTTTTSTSTTSTTTTIAFGHAGGFSLEAQYAMTITSVTGSGTGTPAGFASLSLTSGNYTLPFSGLSAQAFSVTMTGTPPGFPAGHGVKLDLYVNGIITNSTNFSHAGTFSISLPFPLTSADAIIIAIDSY